MFIKGKIKRGPGGRPWGSSKKKSTSNTFKSWTSNNKVAAKGKPPGRPWHSNASTKVCLLCLHQYNQSIISPETSSDEDEEVTNHPITRDPLGDDLVTDIALDAMNSSSLTRGTVQLPVPKRKKSSLYLKFLTIISRHLQVKTKRFRRSALKNELQAPFCQKCTKTVQKLCKVYEELQNAKLGLQWTLRQISDSIKLSKVSVSGKLQCTLLKSLSTQLRVVSSQVVDLFRKHISIRCSAKQANQVPRVSISKHSVVEAVKANWKWKYAFDQMKQYLLSLIVIFALAVPPKDKPPEKKILAIAGPKSKTRKVGLVDEKKVLVKREGGIDAKKENVLPEALKLKREPGHNGEDGGGDDYHSAEHDDHFGEGAASPPGSGPVSPIGGENAEGEDEEGDKNAEDSDWSAGAASGHDSAGSDVEFSVNTNFGRRWNLRQRKTRSKPGEVEDANNDSDTDYVPGELPPLRGAPRRRIIPESDLKFSCNLCSQKFTHDRYMRRHLSLAHAFIMIYNCPKCPSLRFKKSKDLDAHRRKVHPKVPIRPGEHPSYTGHPTACTVCDKMFPSKVKMLIHRRTIHKQMSIMLTCELCGKQIRGQMRMNIHMKTHNRPDKSWRCTKCPRGFATEEGLKTHTKLHDNNPDWVPWTRIKSRKGPLIPREGVFPCDVPGCGRTFYKNSNLIVHKSLHGIEYRCSMCEFRCNLPRDFRKHLMGKHETEDKKFFCLHCDKSYTLEQTYDLHRKVAHPTKSTLPCDVDECQERFENTEQLRQHLKTLHLPPDVEETKENVKFYDLYGNGRKSPLPETKSQESSTTVTADTVAITETKEPLSESVSHQEPQEPTENNDIATVDKNQFEDLLKISSDVKNDAVQPVVPVSETPRLYTCARCDWSFCKKLMYSLHLILHTARNKDRLYACDLCDTKFGVVDSLQTHYNRIHGPKIKPYLCLVCGVRFHRKESFIPHMRIHKDKGSDKNFKCEDCDKTFFDSVNLHKHRRMAHMKNKDGTYSRECDICKERLPGKMALMVHKVDVHGMEKPYKCTTEGCDKSFYGHAQLKDHKICHGEPTFNCTLCDKKFKRRHNLADHVLVHKQEKNHFCEYCGKAFVKKSSLSLHLDIHRGIKKYKCDYCGKAFCRKFARDCHLRVHTKERPFVCSICGRDFAQYSALKIHVKNHERYNNDKIVRVPFRKSIAVGKPLRTRKKKTEENDTKGGNVKGETHETQEEQKVEEPTPTYSGILHEAMKATFDDINIELEMGGLLKSDQDVHGGISSLAGSSTGGVQVIDTKNALTAVAAVEHDHVLKDEDDNEELEVEEPVKKKRGRKPKVHRKEYSCGFCGKTFRREDFYNKHVDRHMQEVEASTTHSEGDASTQSQPSSAMDEQHSLQEVLQNEPEPPSLRTRSAQETEPRNNPINVPQPQPFHHPPPPTLVPAPVLQVQPKRRGRPPKQNNAPGSRLARIVEDVLETAINRPGSANTRHQQQQNQYHHQQQQQFNSPQQNPDHSPSPHHMVHSGSERSTPTGSPAPNQHHHQHQAATNTSTSVSFPNSASSLLSPFLFSNPYLIPRLPDQQNQGGIQQDPMFSGFPNRPQQQQAFPQNMQQQPSVSYPQQQFHQLPIQTTPSQRSERTMPQDLSKNNYSIFYTNQR